MSTLYNTIHYSVELLEKQQTLEFFNENKEENDVINEVKHELCENLLFNKLIEKTVFFNYNKRELEAKLTRFINIIRDKKIKNDGFIECAAKIKYLIRSLQGTNYRITGVKDLPNEVTQIIFSYLSSNDINSFSKTCSSSLKVTSSLNTELNSNCLKRVDLITNLNEQSKNDLLDEQSKKTLQPPAYRMASNGTPINGLSHSSRGDK